MDIMRFLNDDGKFIRGYYEEEDLEDVVIADMEYINCLLKRDNLHVADREAIQEAIENYRE